MRDENPMEEKKKEVWSTTKTIRGPKTQNQLQTILATIHTSYCPPVNPLNPLQDPILSTTATSLNATTVNPNLCRNTQKRQFTPNSMPWCHFSGISRMVGLPEVQGLCNNYRLWKPTTDQTISLAEKVLSDELLSILDRTFGGQQTPPWIEWSGRIMNHVKDHGMSPLGGLNLWTVSNGKVNLLMHFKLKTKTY